RSATLAGSGYHDYELVFDADTQSAALYSGETLLLADVESVTLGSPFNRILWGSNASSGIGSANYAYVNFTVGAPLAGDYNQNGVVDTADYALWRDHRGSTSNPAADGSNNGVVDQSDYEVWQAAFGSSSLSEAQSQTRPVCEPAFVSLAAVSFFLLGSGRILIRHNARELSC